jgi:dTDP-4-amino-4,6-dideoxygalactose transaminase
MDLLKTKGIGTQVHYIPINSHPFYKNKKKYVLNNMSKYFDQCLSLPIFFELTKKQQDYIIKSIKKIIEN